MRHAREVSRDGAGQAAAVAVGAVACVSRVIKQPFQREQPAAGDRNLGKARRICHHRILIGDQPGDGAADQSARIGPEPDGQAAALFLQRSQRQMRDPEPGIEGVVICRPQGFGGAIAAGGAVEGARGFGEGGSAGQGVAVDDFGDSGDGRRGGQIQGGGEEQAHHRLSK